MKRLIALGWLVLLGALIAAIRSMPPAGSADLERFVVLDLGADGSAATSVAEDTALRLVAHLALPPEQDVDPDASHLVTVEVVWTPSTGSPVRFTHSWRSRVERAMDGAPLLLDPDGMVVTEGRILDLDRTFSEGGGRIEIRPVGVATPRRLLLRLFETTVEQNAPPGLVGRTWPRPWPDLTDAERVWAARSVHRPLAPEALVGRTVALLRDVTSPEADDTLPPPTLDPGRSTAINVHGPAELSWPADLDATAVGEAWLGQGVASVPDGALASIHLHNPLRTPVPLEVRSTRPVRHWGQPPEQEDDPERLFPEERKFPVYRVDPDHPPLRVPVASVGAAGALAVDLRVPEPGWRTARWRALDDQGRELAAGEIAVLAAPSPYERYADPAHGAAGDAVRRFVIHPAEARVVEWTSDGPMDLRFGVPIPTSARHPDAYDTPSDLRSRFAPWDLPPDLTIEPLDRADRERRGLVPIFVGTVRLEQNVASERWTELLFRPTTRTVPPRGSPPRHPVLERVAEPGGWQPWHRTALTAQSSIEIPDRGTLAIDHRIAEADVGSTLRVTCDGVTAEAVLGSTRGTALLWPFEPGPASCSLEGPRGAWFARAPGSGTRYAHRTLYRLDGQTLHIDVPRLTAPAVLYVRAYTAPSDPPPTLVAEVDAGRRGTSGVQVRQATDVSRALVPDEIVGEGLLESGGDVVRWTALRVRFGDDALGAPHDVAIRGESPVGRPVYVRFDATFGAPRGSAVQHWPEVGP